jgi:hypothetical protein
MIGINLRNSSDMVLLLVSSWVTLSNDRNPSKDVLLLHQRAKITVCSTTDPSWWISVDSQQTSWDICQGKT